MISELPASFRDPAGRVFRDGGELFRQVNPGALPDYRRLTDSGLARELINAGMLVDFQELAGVEGALKLRLTQLDFISYPYEWSFGQLRDAALLTLTVNLKALEHGMILKDASAYNVQWQGGAPIFIDHGSFTCYRENQPWMAYRQFVMHFLAPLLLMARVDLRCGTLSRQYLDGVPLDLTAKLLPMRTHWELTPLLHIHWHAGFEARYGDSRAPRPRIAALPRARLIGMLRHMHAYIGALRRPETRTEWSDYYQDTNYSSAAFAAKKQAVTAVCRELMPRRTVDFGANTGAFSRLALRDDAVVIAADIDPVAVDRLYAALGGSRRTRLYALVQDLNNPSPGSGLFNGEREAFLPRAHGDLALGLALMHHLRLGANWPLAQIVRLFADAADAAVVEFVPKSDSQSQRLLRSRPDIFPDWQLEAVGAAFQDAYGKCETIRLADSERTLLVLTQRKVRS